MGRYSTMQSGALTVIASLVVLAADVIIWLTFRNFLVVQLPTALGVPVGVIGIMFDVVCVIIALMCIVWAGFFT